MKNLKKIALIICLIFMLALLALVIFDFVVNVIPNINQIKKIIRTRQNLTTHLYRDKIYLQSFKIVFQSMRIEGYACL